MASNNPEGCADRSHDVQWCGHPTGLAAVGNGLGSTAIIQTRVISTRFLSFFYSFVHTSVHHRFRQSLTHVMIPPSRWRTSTMAAVSQVLGRVAAPMDMVSRLG